jgi:hypothetical protein
MSTHPNRSDEVIEDFKKHKLAGSALRRIHDLLLGFEREQAFDRKIARIGMLVVVVLVMVSFYWLSGADSQILR